MSCKMDFFQEGYHKEGYNKRHFQEKLNLKFIK